MKFEWAIDWWHFVLVLTSSSIVFENKSLLWMLLSMLFVYNDTGSNAVFVLFYRGNSWGVCDWRHRQKRCFLLSGTTMYISELSATTILAWHAATKLQIRICCYDATLKKPLPWKSTNLSDRIWVIKRDTADTLQWALLCSCFLMNVLKCLFLHEIA